MGIRLPFRLLQGVPVRPVHRVSLGIRPDRLPLPGVPDAGLAGKHVGIKLPRVLEGDREHVLAFRSLHVGALLRVPRLRLVSDIVLRLVPPADDKVDVRVRPDGPDRRLRGGSEIRGQRTLHGDRQRLRDLPGIVIILSIDRRGLRIEARDLERESAARRTSDLDRERVPRQERHLLLDPLDIPVERAGARDIPPEIDALFSVS